MVKPLIAPIFPVIRLESWTLEVAPAYTHRGTKQFEIGVFHSSTIAVHEPGSQIALMVSSQIIV